MIGIECEELDKSVCECCGKETTRLTRWVYDDDEFLAMYYALFKQDDDVLRMSVTLGGWGDNAGPGERRAFALQVYIDDDQENFNTAVLNADESPWSDVEIIGRTLERDEALADPHINDVFHIVDHAVEEDPALVAFFANQIRGDELSS